MTTIGAKFEKILKKKKVLMTMNTTMMHIKTLQAIWKGPRVY